MRPHPAGGPHGQVQAVGGEQVLEQGERGQVADPAAGLAAPGDQAVGAGRGRHLRLRDRGDLDEDASAPDRRRRHVPLTVPPPVGRPGGEDDGVHLGRQLPRAGGAADGHPYPERAARPAGRVRERGARGGVPPQVENAEAAGPGHRGHQACVRLGEGGDGDDEVPRRPGDPRRPGPRRPGGPGLRATVRAGAHGWSLLTRRRVGAPAAPRAGVAPADGPVPTGIPAGVQVCGHGDDRVLAGRSALAGRRADGHGRGRAATDPPRSPGVEP